MSQFEQEINNAADLIGLSYRHAFLLDNEGDIVKDAERAMGYLKVYRQTPHERPGQVKKTDRFRLVDLTPMFPGEWRDWVDVPMMSRQYDELWVYDQDYKPSGCKLDEYLHHFCRDLKPDGWAIGISPMACFEGPGVDKVLARGEQLDLECNEERLDRVVEELEKRVGAVETSGFVTKSSSNGHHFHGHAFHLARPEGFVKIARFIGSALLLNREGEEKAYDERSGGHQLRSLAEDHWTPSQLDSEVGCLRVTSSLLKPTQPEFVTFTPY